MPQNDQWITLGQGTEPAQDQWITLNPQEEQSDFDWWVEQGLRTVPAVAGSLIGGATGFFGAGVGAIPGAMGGGAIGSAIGNWAGQTYSGREFNPYEFGIESALGAVPPIFGAGKAAGPGIKELGKYAARQAGSGAVEGALISGAATPFQHWAQTGSMNAPLESYGQNIGAGTAFGGVTGGVIGGVQGRMQQRGTPEMPSFLQEGADITQHPPPPAPPKPHITAQDFIRMRDQEQGQIPPFLQSSPEFAPEPPPQGTQSVPQIGGGTLGEAKARADAAGINVDITGPNVIPEGTHLSDNQQVVTITHPTATNVEFWRNKGYVPIKGLVDANGNPQMVRGEEAPLFITGDKRLPPARREEVRPEVPGPIGEGQIGFGEGQDVEIPNVQADRPGFVENMKKGGMGVVERGPVNTIFRQLLSGEEGSLDVGEIWRNLKRLLGRDPTPEEVEAGMRRQPHIGETTGRVAEFPTPASHPINAEINDLMVQLKGVTDYQGRKAIMDRIQALQKQRRPLTYGQPPPGMQILKDPPPQVPTDPFGPRPEIPPQDKWDIDIASEEDIANLPNVDMTGRPLNDISGIRTQNVLSAEPWLDFPGPRRVLPQDTPVPSTQGQQELPLGPRPPQAPPPPDISTDVGMMQEPPRQPSMIDNLIDREIQDGMRRMEQENVPPEMRDLGTGQVPKRVWSETLKRFVTDESGTSEWEFWVIDYLQRKFKARAGRNATPEEIENLKVGYPYIPGAKEAVPVIPDVGQASQMDPQMADSFINDVAAAQDFWQRRLNEFADNNDNEGMQLAYEKLGEAQRVMGALEVRIEGQVPPVRGWDVFDPRDGRPIRTFDTEEEARRFVQSRPELDYAPAGEGNLDPNGPEQRSRDLDEWDIGEGEPGRRPTEEEWNRPGTTPTDPQLIDSLYTRARELGLNPDDYISTRDLEDAVERAGEGDFESDMRRGEEGLPPEPGTNQQYEVEVRDLWEKARRLGINPENYRSAGELADAVRMAEHGNMPFDADIERARAGEEFPQGGEEGPHFQPGESSLIKSDPQTTNYIETLQSMGTQKDYSLNQRVKEAKNLILKSMGQDLSPQEVQRFHMLVDMIQSDKNLSKSDADSFKWETYQLPDGTTFKVDATASKSAPVIDHYDYKTKEYVKATRVSPDRPPWEVNDETRKTVPERMREHGKVAETYKETRFILPDGTRLSGGDHVTTAAQMGVNLTEAMKTGVIRFRSIGSGAGAEIHGPITKVQAEHLSDSMFDTTNGILTVDVVHPITGTAFNRFDKGTHSSEIMKWVNGHFKPGDPASADIVNSFRKNLLSVASPENAHFILPNGDLRAHRSSSHEDGSRRLGIELDDALRAGILRFSRHGGAEASGPITSEQARILADWARIHGLFVDVNVKGKERIFKEFDERSGTATGIRAWINKFFRDEQGATPIADILEVWRKVKRATGVGMGGAVKQDPKQLNWVKEALATPTNATTTLDLSFPGRQGLSMILTPEFWTGAGKMFKGLNYASFKAMDADLRNKPLMRKRINPDGTIGKSFGEEIGTKIYSPASEAGPRAEGIASRWMEMGIGEGIGSKIYRHTPLAYGIRASNRAYLTFLNHLNVNRTEFLLNKARDMSMEALNTGKAREGIMPWKTKFTQAEAAELNPYKNLVRAKEIADFVNTATGHGPLKTHILPSKQFEYSLEKHADLLAHTMFSPGLFASRVRMLNPSTYIMATPFVRKQYLKSAFATWAAWAGVTELAKMAGAEVGEDPTSADFGKVRIGDTRIDPGGGFLQFYVLYNRFYQGGYTSSATEEFHRFGEGFQAETQLSNLMRFGSNKLNPVMKFAYDMMDATEYKPFHVYDRTAQLFVPLFVQDVIGIVKEDPELVPWLIPMLFGVGAQTYSKGESVGKLVDPEEDWLATGGGIADLGPDYIHPRLDY